MLSARAFKPRRQNSAKADDGRRFPQHLRWLRSLPCVLDGNPDHVCDGRIEAMHVDHAGGKGVALKVADYHAVPGCSGTHAEYHQHGARTWERKWRVDLVAVAKLYAAKSPHRHLWSGANG